jgi:WD40 repeat protein
MHQKKWFVFFVIMITLALASQACSLFAQQEAQPEVIVEEEELVVETTEVEEPVIEEEPAWSPELIFFLPHEEKINSVAYSHNNETFATGFYPQVDLFNAADGSLIRSIKMSHSADDLGFTPDDQHIASGISLGGVSVYDTNSGEEIQNFHGGYDSWLDISPNGTMIATGNREGITWLWDINSGELLAELDPAAHIEDYREYLTAVEFSPDGQIIAAGYWDGTVILWQVDTWALIRIFEPVTEYCSAWDLSFSIDGQYLAVGGANLEFTDVVRIWDVAEGEIIQNLTDLRRTGSCKAPVVFSPDGNLLAAGGQDGIYIWTLPGLELFQEIPIEDQGETDWVTDLDFSPDSQRLLAGFWAGYAQVWQVQEPAQ